MINSQIVSIQIIKNIKQKKSKTFHIFKVKYFNLLKKNVDFVFDGNM